MERPEAGTPADDGTGIPADMLVETPKEGQANTEASPNEALARNIGWRPLEEYRGPKEKWIDADAFMDKVQRETPIMRERLRTLGGEAERLRRENAELKRERDEGWGEIVKRSRSAEERGYQYAVDQIEAQMEEAVNNADTATYKALKKQRDALDKMRPGPEAKPAAKPNGPAPEADPAIAAWVDQNPWFNTDRKLNHVAISLEAALMAEKPYLSTADRLREVREEVERRFPEKFTNAARAAPAAAARPGPQGVRPPAKKAKTEADLPPEARATMERLVRQKVLTKEQYLKDFPWEK